MGLFLGNFIVNAIVEIMALKNPVSADSKFTIVTCLYLAKNGISISHQLYSWNRSLKKPRFTNFHFFVQLTFQIWACLFAHFPAHFSLSQQTNYIFWIPYIMATFRHKINKDKQKDDLAKISIFECSHTQTLPNKVIPMPGLHNNFDFIFSDFLVILLDLLMIYLFLNALTLRPCLIRSFSWQGCTIILIYF